jgi:hypothetical protein
MMAREIHTLEEAKKVFPAIWVVYDHPKDYPESFVVRAHYGNFPDDTCHVCATLDEARTWCYERQAGFKLFPSVGDDPVILEMWI